MSPPCNHKFWNANISPSSTRPNKRFTIEVSVGRSVGGSEGRRWAWIGILNCVTLNQAEVSPAYTKFIGEQFVAQAAAVSAEDEK